MNPAFAGNDTWTQEGGTWNLLELTLGKKGLDVREYVPAGATVKLFFTSNGERIKNADGTSPWQEYTNTGDAGYTAEIKLDYMKINGKEVTDVEQVTEWNPTGILQAAAFAGFEMQPLAEWLYDQGYNSTPLAVPDFVNADVEDDTLYFGVSLDGWCAQPVWLSPAHVYTLYSVTEGVITEKLIGLGPEAYLLVDFFLSSEPCVPDSLGGWASSDPYSGTAMLFGYHEFAGYDVDTTSVPPEEGAHRSTWGAVKRDSRSP